MKIFNLAIFTILLFSMTSCKSHPGQWSSTKASLYDYTDLSLDEAFSVSSKVLSKNGVLIATDTVRKQLKVKYYQTVVTVTFDKITDKTTQYKISSRKWGYPQKAAARVVYEDLKEVLK